MKKKKEIIKNKINNIKKRTPRDGSMMFLGVFILMFVMVIGRAFVGGTTAPKLAGANNNSGDVTINRNTPVKQMSFSDIIRDASDIATMDIRGNDAHGTLRDGTPYAATITYDPELLAKLSENGTTVTIDASRTWTDYLGTWVPILMGLFFIWWIFRGMRGGMSGVGRSLAMQNPTRISGAPKTKTTFKDVAGIDSEKQELMEVVDFLRNKDKFRGIGARVPRGVLLSGNPGTGKTLLARAIAGEANVPFFAASGSDFSGIIVGLGVAKIKEIFDMARRNAPCILFIDEIDAIGGHRSRHSFNDQDREQTLNQLLIEMDGFANDSGIIVIGATNRADMLDPALLRPGRFDRQVYIDLPDVSGRREILDLYAKRIKVADDVDLMNVARGTTGFSGADLENLLNEAALHAVRNGRNKIAAPDLDEARDKIIMGPRKVRKMRDADIKLTAYHEAGHAFISQMLSDYVDPIHKATIIPRGRALGMVQHLPIDDKVSLTISEVRANLAMYLAGRAAEEVFFGPDKITTGAESDIAAATRMARYAITTAGLSPKLGLAAVTQASSFNSRTALENASEKTAEMVDGEIRDWLNTAYKKAQTMLRKNRATVEKLATELLARETLTGAEIRDIVFGKTQKKKTPAKNAKRTSRAKKSN